MLGISEIMPYPRRMKPIPDGAAAYVKRFTAPDDRTVLDLIWVFDPADFRELGGQRRPRIYDNRSGETLLDLIRLDCGVTSYAWADDGALTLQMDNGTGLTVSLARDSYATSTDGWVEHPLAAIQAQAADMLRLVPAVVPDEPEPSRTPAWRRIGSVVVAILLIGGFIAAMWDGHLRPRAIHTPYSLGRGAP